MQSSDIPGKLPIPFGNAAGGGYIRTIPTASQIGITDGAASLTDGFVPLNATPIAAGGIPPDIKDMNGILFEVSGWARWVSGGGPIAFDASFASAIGGYPKGAFLQSATTPGLFFVSTAENNSSNPEGSSPAGWQTVVPLPASNAETLAGTVATKFVTPAGLATLRASNAETIAGAIASKFVTPAGLYSIRATGPDTIAGVDDHKYLTPAGLADATSQDLSINGYRVNPPGSDGKQLIEQWGQLRGTYNEGLVTVTFPIEFPHACLNISTTNVSDSGSVGDDSWCMRYGNTLSTFQVLFAASSGGNHSGGCDWRAVGY